MALQLRHFLAILAQKVGVLTVPLGSESANSILFTDSWAETCRQKLGGHDIIEATRLAFVALTDREVYLEMARANKPLSAVTTPDMERFHRLCRCTPEGCTLWMGEMSPKKLGLFEIAGKKHYAVRVAWLIAKGLIPYGHKLEPTCGTQRCVNPEHQKLSPLTTMWSTRKKAFVQFIPKELRHELANIAKDAAKADALERDKTRLLKRASKARDTMEKKKPWIKDDYSELQGDVPVPFVSVVKQR